MSVNLSPLGGAGAQFFSNNGVPLAGGLLYTYLAGTTTPATTYTSISGVTAHANPIVLDSAGRVATGEIWLPDAISYKFVLKDATNALIATWDQLPGINSNIIGFTAQQQTITATASQTVFNLSITYVPATNNLAVFVNGLKQIVGVNYLETDSDTVTFLSGVTVGSLVQFSTASPVSNAVTADNVGYTPAGASAVLTNVQTKLRETVSVKDFGAIGNGVANDSAAIQAAINTGKKLYFPAGTYLCNVSISAFFDWQGDGSVLSVLKPFSTATPIVTNLYQEPDWRYTSITDIGFESASQTGIGFCFGNPTAYVLGMELCGRVVFTRCNWKNFDKGVFKPYGNIGNAFNSCTFQYNNYGYFAQSNNILNPSAPIMHAGADTFNQGEAHENYIAAFCILDNQTGNGNTSWNETIIEFNAGFGIFIDTGALSNPFHPYNFNCIWEEDNATAASVSIQTIAGVQILTPKSIEVKTSNVNYFYSYWGKGGGNQNGINTLNPQAPLGIWLNQNTALNLIGGGFGADWNRIAFSSVGTESTIGASITSNLVSGTDKNIIFKAGTSQNFGLQPNGSVAIGSSAVSLTPPVDGSHLIYSTAAAVNTHILDISCFGGAPHSYYVMDASGFNAAAAGYKLGSIASTGRSINAGGTINASGADYAEYMTKAGDFTIAKGDICGIDVNGKLTNVFDNAISFVVKSTNPSYVGGDTWGTDLEGDELEAARQAVDRIAFAGQVPVNVDVANVGDYIIPVNDNGAIKGQAVASPTLEQYLTAVGKVIAKENNKVILIVKVA